MGYILSAIGYIAGYLAILFQAIAIGKFKFSQGFFFIRGL
jgi:hypothetical protein